MAAGEVRNKRNFHTRLIAPLNETRLHGRPVNLKEDVPIFHDASKSAVDLRRLPAFAFRAFFKQKGRLFGPISVDSLFPIGGNDRNPPNFDPQRKKGGGAKKILEGQRAGGGNGFGRIAPFLGTDVFQKVVHRCFLRLFGTGSGVATLRELPNQRPQVVLHVRIYVFANAGGRKIRFLDGVEMQH